MDNTRSITRPVTLCRLFTRRVSLYESFTVSVLNWDPEVYGTGCDLGLGVWGLGNSHFKNKNNLGVVVSVK